MYNFSLAGKAIARGDEMNKLRKFADKKYLSSLVIAAFLLLSVLTAYNIKMGKETPKDTEVKETIGDNDDVITKEENQGYSQEDDALRTEESTDGTENAVDKEENSAAEQEDNRQDKSHSRAAANTSGENFHYDGKEKLTWPVMGTIILPYSMDTTVYYTTLDQYACNDGILIGAKKGQEVVAAADGRVVNVFSSDRYGKMMTILIGDYYEITCGQLENIQYEVGDEVKKGEVIAAVAKPSRTFTLEGPHLFMKMTCKGEAINPTEYLED